MNILRVIVLTLLWVMLVSCPPPSPPANDPEIRIVRGTEENDTLMGADVPESIEGLGGNDIISGGGGADIISGGRGNDTLNGGSGNDTALFPLPSAFTVTELNNGRSYRVSSTTLGVDTISNIETIQFSFSPDAIIISESIIGTIALNGSDGSDIIIMGNNPNTLNARNFLNIELYQGGTSIDTIVGGIQSEEFFGGQGNDIIDGGPGIDSALYPRSTTVNIAEGSNGDLIVSAGEDGTDTLRNIERITLSDTNNEVTITGMVGFISIDAGEGIDRISLPSNEDSVFFTSGQYINFETIQGGVANDTIYAGDGEETIDGGDGTDIVVYSEPNEYSIRSLDSASNSFELSILNTEMLTDSNGNVTTEIIEITDILANIEGIRLSNGNDTLSGYMGNRETNIHIDGGRGNDGIILADSGIAIDFALSTSIESFEIIMGGSGDDIFENVDPTARLQIDGMGGSDTISFASPRTGTAGVTFSPSMFSNFETIEGSAGNDSISGTDSDETIRTLQGNDSIESSGGNDTIVGGEGNDTVRYIAGNVHTIVSTDTSTNSFQIESRLNNLSFGTDTLADINVLEFSNEDDVLMGTAFAGITINTAGGNDIIRLDHPNRTGIYSIITGSGNDTIVIPADPDNIFINDFSPSEDTIDFSRLYAATNINGIRDIVIQPGEIFFQVGDRPVSIYLNNNSATVPNLSFNSTPVETIASTSNTDLNLMSLPSFPYVGEALAISNDTLIMGIFSANNGRGSAYILHQDSSGDWTIQMPVLSASDAEPSDLFGISVDIDGDTVIIGSPGDDDSGDFSGSAYIFSRINSIWTQTAKITADDGAEGDEFGRSVSISGNTIIVGAPYSDDNGNRSGSAYIFTRSGNSWTQMQKLTAGDASASDRFGLSLGISGDTAIISAQFNDDDGSNSGSAYIFTRSASSWTQVQKLNASNAQSSDEFGNSVAISGGIAIVGASNKDIGSSNNAGSAYIFARNDSGLWPATETRILSAEMSDANSNDTFGTSVSIDGTIVVVGASGDSEFATNAGAIYIFTPNDAGIWTEFDKILQESPSSNNAFGRVVDIDGITVLAGNRNDGSIESAYTYRLPGP